MSKWSWIFTVLIICSTIMFLSGTPKAGDPGEDMPPVPIIPDQSSGWCYATIEYRDDLIAANKFFWK